MGLFNWKKEKKSPTNGLFIETKTLSRKENKERLQKIQHDHEIKDALCDKLNEAYKKVLLSEQSDLADNVLNLIYSLRDMHELSNNKRALFAIQGLIQVNINCLESYTELNDFFGMARCIDEIRSLIYNLYSADAYYESADYIQFRVSKIKAELDRSTNEHKLIELSSSFKEIKKAAQTQLSAELQRSVHKLFEIQEDYFRVKRNIDAFDTTINSTKNMISRIEESARLDEQIANFEKFDANQKGKI